MLVRVRSRDGNFRFTLDPQDDISALVSQILATSDQIDPDTLALSNQPRGGENLVSAITGDLQSLGISHGDLLFASYKPKTAPSALSSAPASGAATPARVGAHRPWEGVEEDPVDVHWEQRDGKIPRPKGQHGCRCGPKSMCDYCMPLEPFDAEYHASHNIKHLSYHAYLKKLHASIPTSAQASTYIPPLAPESYRVAVPCSSGSHPSWPAGICTKCQPSAVTLSRQSYRMTDHVEFSSPALIDGLLSFWRQTGTQRFGYLLGRYEPYDEVPMGVKAVVEAIHEPPQEPHADGIAVGFPWDEEPKVRALAAACGLDVVGVIFTDLTQDKSSDEAKKQGKVVAKRHANAFFLSSLEVLFAASLQRKYPTVSRFSTSGQFSSRFVTCVLSGDIEGSIAVEAYQVSDQATSMLDADMVEASVDPGVVRVKDEGPERYIPDVFYRYKNSYGLEVKESAKPCFPVEYLIVNVTHGFPLKPNPRFVSPTPFVKENRAGLEDQTLSRACGALAALLGGKDAVSEIVRGGAGFNAEAPADEELDIVAADSGAKAVATWLSDWHLLRFLTDCGMFEEDDLRTMARIATLPSGASTSITQSRELARTLVQLFASPNWQTFLVVAQEQAPQPPARDYPGAQQPQQTLDGFDIPPDVDVPPSAAGVGGAFGDESGAAGGAGGADAGAGAAGDDGIKVCPHCTFENGPGAGQDCEVCGLPLAG
ncbi:uncharacterized protein RHOBADRAFT_31231 [Rhodotorula graminis WP1]|uniref:Nuclear protein localization protein 4 n=1 Tax=Rhodotorula graminis (strain WP1) TaxID=578459 RepID=A0A194SDM4_RHOGW|nr:uncharacterized protein RHOBADRAFT_31231 [Rhodotorula graminis WP1]KPV77506.1 hypothetical protein RHOBADRAFT_31231 [Rhodotorula graminis WP1]